MRRPTDAAWVVAALLSLAACAPTRGERVARDVATIAAERTPDKLLDRGLAYAQVGDLTRAEQYLVAALDGGASADVVLPKLLVVCVANAHYRAGIAYAAPELQRNPDNASLRFVVAELEALIGDAAAARQDLDKVTAAQPADPAPHFAYARLLRDDVGDPVGADREFRAYLTLDPSGAHANEARAFLLKPVVPKPAPPPASSPVPVPLPLDGAEKR
jgi:Tfp pilus assembly protein PilF